MWTRPHRASATVRPVPKRRGGTMRRMTDLLTDPDAVRAALADDSYRMPPVDPLATTGIAWLRAAVARFCDGAPHARRRALATDLLDAIDPDELRVRARDRTGETMAAKRGPVEVMSAIARPV